MAGMQLLIWIGAGICLLGVVGLVATGMSALKLRGANLEDDELRAALQKGVVRNMIALFVAVIGLMMVMVGLAMR